HPRLKARFGEWFYTWQAIQTFNRRYLVKPPRLEAEVDDAHVEGVTAIVQNASPYTFFGKLPVHVGEEATLQSGDLSGVVLERASPVDIPTIIWRALSRHARISRHRQVSAFGAVSGLHVRSLDERPLPIQVDGDYIGEAQEAAFSVRPGGIRVVS
ncbi:MAG: hypothetical protein JOZ73_08045, partial [Solirubrobacterales bacterium]|nr:hypothetical protein [Solirubrobacterales bacterium]